MTDCSIAHKENMTDVAKEATFWLKYNGACLFFFTFITSFYVGSWSDRLGRKFPMIVPCVGTVIAASINCVLSFFLESHVAYLFVSSAISGITFGSVGVISSTFGFISDVTIEKSRTKRIVVLEAMIFIGGTIGIYIGGTLLKNIHYEQQLNSFVQLYIFEAVVSFIIVLYIFFRIPSHVNDSQQMPVMGLFNLKHVTDSLKTVFRSRDGGKRKVVLLLLTALLLIYIASVVQLTLAYYYVKINLGWSFNKYSQFNSIQFAVEGAALLIGLPTFFHFLKIPDHFIAMLGMISRIAGFIVFGLSRNDEMVYTCAVLYIFSEYPVPATRSMLSKTVAADERGRIFAFATILQNLCYLLGMLVLTTESSSNGLTFEVAAALQVLVLLLFVYLYLTRKEIITVYETLENEDGSIEETCSVVASSGSIN